MAAARRRMVGALLVASTVLAACSGGDDPAEVEAEVEAEIEPPAETADASDTTAATSAPVTDPPATTEPLTTQPATSDPDTTEPAAPSRCDPVAAADADGTTTVRVWHALSGNVEGYFQALIGQFQAEHPNIRIEPERLTTGYPALVEQLAATPDTDLPDLVMGSNLTVRLQADSGRFVPIGECTGGEPADQFTDLLPVIRRTYTVDDTLWAAPFNVSAPVMLYDRTRWARAGLDPDDPPADVPALAQTIRQLRDSGEAGVGAVLYDRSAMWLLEQAAVQNGRLLVEPANGHDGATVDAVRFESPEAVDVLTTMRELTADGYVEWLGLNASGNEDLSRMVFPTSPAGLTFNSSAVLGDILRLIDTGNLPPVEVGVAPFPGPGRGSTVGGGAWWLLDRGDPALAGAAWTFVDWLTQPDVIAGLAAYTGYVPTTLRAAEHETTQQHWSEWPIFRVAYDQVADTPDSDAGAGLQVGPMADVLRDLELAAAYAIDVGNDPAEELRLAEQRTLELLRLYAETAPR